jgi:hypothetical protein
MATLLVFAAAPVVQAAITWDAGGGNPWWFDTDNWSEDDAMVLPPMSDADNDPETDDLSVTDAVINFIPSGFPVADFNEDGKVSAADYTVWRDHVGADPNVYTLPNRDPGNTGNIGTNDYEDWIANYGAIGNWNQGEGVVYDPGSDPFYDPGSTRFTAPYDEHTIWRLYMARHTDAEGETNAAVFTIKDDLITDNTRNGGDPEDTRWQIGRSSGVANVASNGIIVHESGTVINVDGDIDLGSNDSGLLHSYGNGTYDYRGGTLEQGIGTTNRRFRLSAGGQDSAGGIGTVIMHNPTTAGHFRVRELLVASFGGQGENNPDGVNRGVGILEFHYENDGTRPIQVTDNMVLANGDNASGQLATRSSRLRLVLDEAPCDGGAGCVPDDIGLVDVDSDLDGFGLIGAPGGLPSTLGVTFSNADPTSGTPLDVANVYDEGDTVSAIFGGIQYNWMISYMGNILWNDIDDSDVGAIEDNANCTDINGNCVDVVLLGLSSVALGAGSGSSLVSVPEPSGILLVFAAAVGLLTVRRRG